MASVAVRHVPRVPFEALRGEHLRAVARTVLATWTGRLFLLVPAWILAYLAAWATRPWGAGGVQFLSDFGEVPVQLAGAALAFAILAREPRLRGRVAWALVGLAIVADMAGNLLYGAYDLAGETPFPSLADAFYLAFYPLLLGGLMALPTASRWRELFGWRVWSNVAIVVLGGGMAVLHFILLPTVGQLSNDRLATVISLAYPAADLALLAALGTIAARRPYARDRVTLTCLIVGVGTWFFADLGFAILSAAGGYEPGSLPDLLWLAGDAAFAVAAEAHLVGLPPSFEPSEPLAIGHVGPYVMLALGLATLVAAAVNPMGEMALLVALQVCLTVIVVLRQLADEQQRRAAEAALLAEHAAAAQEAARQARRDPLTQLPNRASVHEILAAEIAASGITGRSLSLVFVDLNAFKAVNDNLGHAAGDQLLVEVARRLEAAIRSGDTVARLGGDEFAVILPGTRVREAAGVAQRALSALERPFTIGGTEVEVSGAFGLAGYPESGAADGDGLMRQADTAMYRAKRRRLGITAFDARLDATDRAVSELAALRDAIRGDALVAAYQPILDHATGRTTGAEALARWRHPTRGLLAAGEFVPLAVQTGLVRALDARMLGLAVAQARAWADQGLRLTVNINVSRDSLDDPAFPELVAGALREHGVPGETIELEITEDGLLDNPAQAAAFIARMRELGVRTAIDDFGTGFSSLSRLRDLPVDTVKIDRTFLRGARDDGADAAIVEFVTSLGHRLGLRVVAEGVEDERTAAWARARGVDAMQGFLFGRPVSADEITRRCAGEVAEAGGRAKPQRARLDAAPAAD